MITSQYLIPERIIWGIRGYFRGGARGFRSRGIKGFFRVAAKGFQEEYGEWEIFPVEVYQNKLLLNRSTSNSFRLPNGYT